jgi:hypothetical protein
LGRCMYRYMYISTLCIKHRLHDMQVLMFFKKRLQNQSELLETSFQHDHHLLLRRRLATCDVFKYGKPFSAVTFLVWELFHRDVFPTETKRSRWRFGVHQGRLIHFPSIDFWRIDIVRNHAFLWIQLPFKEISGQRSAAAYCTCPSP